MKNVTGLVVMSNWNSLIDVAVFRNPDVETVGFKLYWSRIQTTENTFNWDILNENLLNCAKYDKKFVIELATGIWTPDFVYQSPYNVPKVKFKEFKRASIPEPPLKEFNVPLFTDSNYKFLVKQFLTALSENIANLKYETHRDVARLFNKISVSGVNETTAEARINSQVNLSVGDVVSTNAIEIWHSHKVYSDEVIETIQEFYAMLNYLFPRQEKTIYMLGKGFPELDDTNIENAIANWVADENFLNISFAYTSVTVTNNGGSLFEYIKSLGIKVGGELNQRLYEYCDSFTLDKVLNAALSGGFSFMQIRDDNVLNSPEVVAKYKNAFR
jgi:hypothetical protein